MMMKKAVLVSLLLPALLWADVEKPRMLFQSRGKTMAIMRLPDGSFAFYNRYRPEETPLSLPDKQDKDYTLLPSLPKTVLENQAIMTSKVLNNTQVILTEDNQVVNVFVKGSERFDREKAKEVGLARYLDVWVHREGGEEPVEPHMIWRGYNGSQMEYQQFPSGRILVPFGSMQRHARAVPPTGRHATIILYSDDLGTTWQQSPARLISPCYEGYNGSNEGACEPAIEMLKDGRIWMLTRSQTGFHNESFSTDDGTTWADLSASRFHTSTGPPNIMRHKNGWLIVTWNNCELPLRHEGQGVYGGRDALHIAVSDDDGKTWRGFREIYLDFRRNDNPAKTGDRGTAYPLGAYTHDGEIVMLAGQGEGGRNPIVIDPAWIIETKAHTDFSDGLEQWSVYKHYGPAKGWWRARAVGCALIDNPDQAEKKCLLVRKPDELASDGAVWNFPNGWQGTLHARVMFRNGFQGGMICLNDRFFDPSNDMGEQFATYRTTITPDGKWGTAQLDPDTWYDLTLHWDCGTKTCRLMVNGKEAGKVTMNEETLNGVSYVRFRSMARSIDQAGFLVDEVKVTIDDPYAPACTREDKLRVAKQYVQSIVPLW